MVKQERGKNMKAPLAAHIRRTIRVGLLAALAAVAAGVVLPASAGALTFDVTTTPLADINHTIATGDVNGDGNADLVTADGALDVAGTGGTVSVLLGNGDGTFHTPAATYGVGNMPVSVAVGDLNGDGAPDIVTANYNDANGISVLLNNGNGTFKAAVGLSTGAANTRATSVAIGDLNGDGKPDLAVTEKTKVAGVSDQVSVLLGKGDGTFQTPVTYAISPNEGPSSVAIGDLNGDGNPDLAISELSNLNGGAVKVLLGNGDGTFGAATGYEAGNNATQVAIGDMNGDGKLDLVTSNSELNNWYVSVLLGNGDGTFQTSTHHTVPDAAVGVALADLNADGALDVVADGDTAGQGNGLNILLGNGDGTLQAPQSELASGHTNAVTITDVNSDARPDIAAVNAQAASVSTLLNSPGPLRSNGLIAYDAPGSGVAAASSRRPLGSASSSGPVGIWTANPDGSGATEVASESNAADEEPVFSPSGRQIAFVNGDGHIAVMDANGQHIWDLTPNDAPGGVVDEFPSWSADGTKIYFSRVDFSQASPEYDIWVMNASDGSGQTNLTAGTGIDSRDPVVSPDGSTVAFVRGNPTAIWTMGADGGHPARLTRAADFDDSSPAWSPDGTKLVFSQNVGGSDSDLYLIDSNGKGETQLTNTPTMEEDAATWGPNGTKIIVRAAVRPDGPAALYTVNPATGKEGANPIPNTTGADHPNWQAAPLQSTLNVTEAGSGTGVVYSSPSGINCGQTCSAKFDDGSAVVLTAAPASGSAFTGWSGGGCSGTSTCTVTITGDETVTATFAHILIAPTGVVATAVGTGEIDLSWSAVAGATGYVVSRGTTPGGPYTPVATPTTHSYRDQNTALSPATTYYYVVQATSGGDTSPRSAEVSATTKPLTHTLTVNETGSGIGAVTSSPSGINCPSSCSSAYASGTSVVLIAAPQAGSTFSGWSGGGCSGQGTCTVAVNSDATVTAEFEPSTPTGCSAGPVRLTAGGVPLPTSTTHTVKDTPGTLQAPGTPWTAWSAPNNVSMPTPADRWRGAGFITLDAVTGSCTDLALNQWFRANLGRTTRSMTLVLDDSHGNPAVAIDYVSVTPGREVAGSLNAGASTISVTRYSIVYQSRSVVLPAPTKVASIAQVTNGIAGVVLTCQTSTVCSGTVTLIGLSAGISAVRARTAAVLGTQHFRIHAHHKARIGIRLNHATLQKLRRAHMLTVGLVIHLTGTPKSLSTKKRIKLIGK